MLHLFQRTILSAGLLAFLGAAMQTRADEPTTIAKDPTIRWSKDGPGGSPSFTRHIVPLLSKAGCNNRSCHGSFQGKGGLQLSLFGYEPDLDYRELVNDEDTGPRVNVKDADGSLALLKPLAKTPHKGKKRFDENSWQHRMFRQWIADGAKFDKRTEAKLVALSVVPPTLRTTDRRQVSLRVVAKFSNGDREDVTSLAAFSSNDDGICKVSDDGRVTISGEGATSIVVKYGDGIATCPVVVPRESRDAFPDFPANNKIDELVAEHLRNLNIRPSGLCADEVFLRRVYIDTIGTLPTAEETHAFLNDKSPDKRKRLIDRLLDRPEYSMYWATKFSDWLGNNGSNLNQFFKVSWLVHDWLHAKLEKNWTYDRFVGGILTATSLEGRTYEEYLKENKAVAAKMKPRSGFDDGIYAKRKTLDLYWLRRGVRPKDLAIRSANTFLGLQIQCAECHNHPFDRWTQNDFNGFTSFFRTVDTCDLDGSPRSGGRLDYHIVALYRGLNRREKGMVERYPPKILDGPVVPYKEDGPDPRIALWKWMTAPDNRFFARNIANRLWHHYFGVGIVDPVDDLNEANPPSNPALLDWLARDFIEHKFDLKHLHRRILNSRTYQLSYRPNDSNRTDKRHFSHALVRRMQAEAALDAIVQVTGTSLKFNGYAVKPETKRAIGLAAAVRYGKSEYFMQTFGRPKRQQTCACERSTEPSLAQALFFINDADILDRIADPKGRLEMLLKKHADNRQLIEELYLICLSRYPQERETQLILEYAEKASSRREAFQDVMWSLVNVREFLFVR